MALTAGTRIGPYAVVTPIGAGGMGEVYRARDAKLNRDVAIKILLPAVANDPDRLARFSREAQVLASLNHPNIAQIYGQESLEGGAIALVMELVEGPTLADRIEALRGSGAGLTPDEALPVARQICEALEAAHEQNIIHRDLKPANIKVRPDGTVKVLDFGLAKAIEPAGSAPGSVTASMSPTITTPAPFDWRSGGPEQGRGAMTHAGVILGTAAYMSPEQARGKPVDKRADIWAFGAILFEMLTGARAFTGEDITDTIVAVVSKEPDWRRLEGAASRVRPLIARCLAKDPKRRMRDIGEARLQIDELLAGRGEETVTPGVAAKPESPVSRIAPYAAAVLLALVTGVTVWRFTRPVEAPRPLARFTIDLPAGIQLSALARNHVAVSPDGTRFAYVANQRLYMRALDQIAAVPIPGTETGDFGGHGRSPFFSPDGQWVGFWQTGQLKKVAVSGGAPVTICDAPNPLGVSWEPNDEILFAAGTGGIMRVPGTGGTATPVITLKDGERAISPRMIPGGDWLLFMFHPKDAMVEQGQAVVQSRTTGERRVLLEGARDVRYVPSGHLLFGRSNTLLAQAFDARRLTLSGGPVPVLEMVANAGTTSPAQHVALSSTGTLFYVPGAGANALSATKLVQVARDGTPSPLTDVAGMAWFPRYSPDGTRVAFGISATGSNTGDASDLWVVELARGARTRVTFGGNNRYYPIWTRDGTRLTFADSSEATNRIVSALADGTGGLQTVLDKKQRYNPSSWSPDGRTLAFHIGPQGTPTTTRDLWVLRVDGDNVTSAAYVETPFHERGAIFSPDGRWVAYVSDKSGRNDVFARPYPGPGSEVTISVGGGQEPVWAPNGRELFYRHDGKLLAVPIQATATALTVGAPVRVFDDSYVLDIGGANGGMANYDVSPDGKRFVMVEEPRAKDGRNDPIRLQVVLNWTEELKQRVPTR